MKVILIQNVPFLGQKNDIKEVKPGYWRNFLMPQGFAIEATDELIKQAQKKREEVQEKKEKEEKALLEKLEKTEDKALVINARADEKGNLFAGIGAKRISKALKDKMQIDVSFENIEIEKPIKKTGQHEIKIKDSILKVEVKKE